MTINHLNDCINEMFGSDTSEAVQFRAGAKQWSNIEHLDSFTRLDAIRQQYQLFDAINICAKPAVPFSDIAYAQGVARDPILRGIFAISLANRIKPLQGPLRWIGYGAEGLAKLVALLLNLYVRLALILVLAPVYLVSTKPFCQNGHQALMSLLLLVNPLITTVKRIYFRLIG